jgi:hypothetical protein
MAGARRAAGAGLEAGVGGATSLLRASRITARGRAVGASDPLATGWCGGSGVLATSSGSETRCSLMTGAAGVGSVAAGGAGGAGG